MDGTTTWGSRLPSCPRHIAAITDRPSNEMLLTPTSRTRTRIPLCLVALHLHPRHNRRQQVPASAADPLGCPGLRVVALPHRSTGAVIPRACGVSSTPRPFGWITDASGILDPRFRGDDACECVARIL